TLRALRASAPRNSSPAGLSPPGSGLWRASTSSSRSSPSSPMSRFCTLSVSWSRYCSAATATGARCASARVTRWPSSGPPYVAPAATRGPAVRRPGLASHPLVDDLRHLAEQAVEGLGEALVLQRLEDLLGESDQLRRLAGLGWPGLAERRGRLGPGELGRRRAL